MKAISRQGIQKFTLWAILLLGTFFRFFHLGYSEFQGDEIEAISFISYKGSFINFLFERSKGPGQYVISLIVHVLSGSKQAIFANMELITRLPFALAGSLTLLIIFLVAKKTYDQKTAFLCTLFCSLLGMFIAFSRITQYQSFIILFSVLVFYLITSYLKNDDKKLLLVSGFLSGVSLLFHYDSLGFILPILLILVVSRKFKGALMFLAPLVLTSALFYIPFILSPNFAKTVSYLWSKRINSGNMDSITQSLTIISIYSPKELIVAIPAGLVLWIVQFVKKVNKFISISLLLFILSMLLRIFITGDFEKGALYFNLVTGIIFFASHLFFLIRDKSNKVNSIEIWFLTSFLIYGIIIKFPLTHIYNFFIPLLILSSNSLSMYLGKFKKVSIMLCGILILSLISFNFQAFINTSTEYPWQAKKYVFGSMYQGIADKNQVKGVFGFPYNRGWRDIKKAVLAESLNSKIATYSTNEKTDISSFYLNDENYTFLFDQTKPDIYVYVKRPQSLVNTIKLKGTPFAKTAKYELYRKDNYKVGF